MFSMPSRKAVPYALPESARIVLVLDTPPRHLVYLHTLTALSWHEFASEALPPRPDPKLLHFNRLSASHPPAEVHLQFDNPLASLPARTSPRTRCCFPPARRFTSLDVNASPLPG